MGTSVPGSTPNTSTTETGGTPPAPNPTPASNPTGTEVVETNTGAPDASGGGTTPPGLAGLTTVSQPDPYATGMASTGEPNSPQPVAGTDDQPIPGQPAVAQPGTGTIPAATDTEIAEVHSAQAAPGEHATTHMLVRNNDINLLRRLWSDMERGIEGSKDRLREALGRVFG
jgi:hypothetical protein